MKQRWQKLGNLYTPPATDRHPLLLSHAANPLPLQLEGDLYRVYYSGRDAHNRSSVGAVDIDVARREVVRDHDEPFFTYGPPGSYYADGVSIGCCYTVDGSRYMLFMGWQTPAGHHWRGDIGRLQVNADFSLQLADEQPLLGSTAEDPISLSYPWVQPLPTGGYQMWYGSTLAWDAGNGEMLHVIKAAHSDCGHQWRRDGLAVPYVIGLAQAFSRPTVAENSDGSADMWFSYRSGNGENYRIGYAHRQGSGEWILDLVQTGIDLSQSGWDSEMIEYPFVFHHGGSRYMLYNGNGYGRTGFGIAVIENV